MREDYLENIYLFKNEHCEGCGILLLIEEDYYCNVCEHFYKDELCKRCGTLLSKEEYYNCSECEYIYFTESESEEEGYCFDFHYFQTGVTKDISIDMMTIMDEETFMVDEETLIDDEEIKNVLR